MNCKCNIKILLVFVYIIVYLVVRIYNNPKFEYYSNPEKAVFNEPTIASIDPRGNHIGVTFNRPQNVNGLAKYMLFLKDSNNNRILEKTIDFTESSVLNEAFYSHLIRPNTRYVLTIIAYNINNEAGLPTVKNIDVLEEVDTNNNSLDIQLLSRIARDKEIFLKQEREQAVQNRKIAVLKRKVDQYRDDIVILKNNDKEELKNIYAQMGYNDSASEALSSNNGDLNNALNVAKNGGKNYNLNFNLDE